jgi:hypothetical protein
MLADALRYEMACEMIEGLDARFKVTLIPAIAQLPSITEIGMAALLPGADGSPEIAEAGAGKIALRLGGVLLKDRAARIKYLKENAGVRVADLKLNDLMKPSKRVIEAISGADLIAVTSQEIDRLGEEGGSEDEIRYYMTEVLDKLRKGIRRLASLGVDAIVIAADHGYLFGEAVESGMKMDPPGGKTADLHKRVWVGRGGTSPESGLRIPVKAVGLQGDLELVIPRGLGCFKAKSGSPAYFHGGASLQELVIPVVVVKCELLGPEPKEAAVIEVVMERPRVTTRFFSVTVTYAGGGLFPSDEIRVKVVVRSGKKGIGGAVMAAYGFEEGTGDITLEKGRADAVTLMIQEDGVDTVSVHISDAATQVELKQLKDIPVDIAM